MTQNEAPSLLEKLKSWRSTWKGIARSLDNGETLSLDPSLPENQVEQVRQQMHACLQAKGGEVSARSRAAKLGHAYLEMNQRGRRRFLEILLNDFGPNEALIEQASAALCAAKDREAKQVARRELKDALEPQRIRLLTQFNALPEGIKFLVDMRAEILGLARQDKVFQELSDDIQNLLAAWFDVGFLELQRITWQSPASVLEKIIEYEAVHTIQSWSDLKNRLAKDRRLFGFFHPRMPEEPLIFVEVALVNGMASNIQALLDEDAPLLDPEMADTAIFYSISNAQAGLAGISFGDFLIKKVVAALSAELPNLKNFATLSPIPGFKRWLDQRLLEGEANLLTPLERRAIEKAMGRKGAKGLLKELLSTNKWTEDKALIAALYDPLMRLCARYLMSEKRSNTDGRALDPVAHFHLSNGARMERINWLGDSSNKGLKQSAGMMINYFYKLSDIEKNHERYRGDNKVTASSQLKSLLKGS